MSLAIKVGSQASSAGFVRAPTHNASAWSSGQRVQSTSCGVPRRAVVTKSSEQNHRLLSSTLSCGPSRVTMAGKDKMVSGRGVHNFLVCALALPVQNTRQTSCIWNNAVPIYALDVGLSLTCGHHGKTLSQAQDCLLFSRFVRGIVDRKAAY